MAPGTPNALGSAGPLRSPTALAALQALRWSGVPSAHQLGAVPSPDWAHHGASSTGPGPGGVEALEVEEGVEEEVDGSACVWGVQAAPSHQRSSPEPPGS